MFVLRGREKCRARDSGQELMNGYYSVMLCVKNDAVEDV